MIISLDGSSGCMTYVPSHKFALNHHAGFFQASVKPKQQISLEFFSLFFERQLREASISEGSKTLNLETLEHMDFNIPSYDFQEQIMLKIRPLLELKVHIASLVMRIGSIKERTPSIMYENYQARDVPISQIFDCYRGNSGLTEKEIYHNIFSEGEKYEVLSSSTEGDTRLGLTPIFKLNGKTINVFEDKEGILVIRNGKAGTTFFLNKGKYTITDHAYILCLRKDCKYEISLKWFMNQFRQEFFNYVSSADNATWNMTGFFKNTIVDIPAYQEQLQLAGRYDYLETLEMRMMAIQQKINLLFERQVVD